MDSKPDGRLYSRILRRSVAIVQNLSRDREMTIGEMAEQVHEKNITEFYLKRFDRSVSSERIRDYIRYLRDIKVISAKDDKFILDFPNKATDQEWAQAMSDRALEHLAKILKKTPDKVPDFLETGRNKLLKSRRVPTLDAIISDLEIEGGETSRDLPMVTSRLYRWTYLSL